MHPKIDFSFQVYQTSIQVRYEDITRCCVDTLISSDDIFLSGASGLSRAIRGAAGSVLEADIAKFATPRALGSVVVTGGGRLSAKHIIHAITVDFSVQPRFELTVPLLIRRVLDTAGALGVETLALPMLNEGLVKVPTDTILRVLLQGAAAYLAENSQHAERPTSVRQIILAVYNDNALDHAAAEAEMYAELQAICAQIEQWDSATRPINRRLALLQSVSMLPDDGIAPPDAELQQEIQLHIEAARAQLRALFGGPQAQQHANQLQAALPRAAEARDDVEFRKMKKLLQGTLKKIAGDVRSKERQQRILRTNLQRLEEQKALYGINAPLVLLNELDEQRRQLRQCQGALLRLKEEQGIYNQHLEQLRRQWETEAEVAPTGGQVAVEA